MSDRDYETGYESCLEKAVAALNEAIKDPEQIIRLLHKYWNLDYQEANNRIALERTELYPRRAINGYLIAYKGYLPEDADIYVNGQDFRHALRKINKPWTLSPEKLYENIKKETNKFEQRRERRISTQ